MSDLVVELYGKPIGRLVGSRATHDFVASAEVVEGYGLDSTVLSLAVPLAPSRRAGASHRGRIIVEDEVPAHGAHPGLVEDIRAFTANLRAGRSVGAELSRSQGGA